MVESGVGGRDVLEDRNVRWFGATVAWKKEKSDVDTAEGAFFSLDATLRLGMLKLRMKGYKTVSVRGEAAQPN